MKGTRERVEIDWKGSCVLCLKFKHKERATKKGFEHKETQGPPSAPVELEEEEGPTISSKYKQLLDHLGVDILQMFAFTSVWEGEKSKVNLDLKVAICKNCSALISEFLLWFQELERVNAELYRCAVKLSQTIGESGEDAVRVAEYKKRNATQMESLRMETIQKCKSRVSSSVPIIVINDNDDFVPGSSQAEPNSQANPASILMNHRNIDGHGNETDSQATSSASGPPQSGSSGMNDAENVVEVPMAKGGHHAQHAVEQSPLTAPNLTSQVDRNEPVVDTSKTLRTLPVSIMNNHETSTGGTSPSAEFGDAVDRNVEECCPTSDPSMSSKNADTNTIPVSIVKTSSICQSKEVQVLPPNEASSSARCRIISLATSNAEKRNAAKNVAGTKKNCHSDAKTTVDPVPPPVSHRDVKQHNSVNGREPDSSLIGQNISNAADPEQIVEAQSSNSNDDSGHSVSAPEHRNDGRMDVESEEFTASCPVTVTSITVSPSSSRNAIESVTEQAQRSSATGSEVVEEYNIGVMEGLDSSRDVFYVQNLNGRVLEQPNTIDESTSSASASKRVPCEPCEISPGTSPSTGIHTVSERSRVESPQPHESISSMTASQIASNLKASTASIVQSRPQEAAAMTEQVGGNGNGEDSRKRHSDPVGNFIYKKHKCEPSTATSTLFSCKQCDKALKSMDGLIAHKIIMHPFSQVLMKLPRYSYEAEFERHVKEMMGDALLKGKCYPCGSKNNSYVPAPCHIRMHLLHKHMNYVVRKFWEKKSMESEGGGNAE